MSSSTCYDVEVKIASSLTICRYFTEIVEICVEFVDIGMENKREVLEEIHRMRKHPIIYLWWFMYADDEHNRQKMTSTFVHTIKMALCVLPVVFIGSVLLNPVMISFQVIDPFNARKIGGARLGQTAKRDNLRGYFELVKNTVWCRF